MDTLRIDEEEGKIKSEMTKKRTKKLEMMRRFNLFYNPIFVLSFALVYWVAGLRHAEVI